MGSPINEISEIHVKQYADSLSHEFQQTDSVLAPYCIQQSINSEKFSYDVIGQLGINEKSSIFSANNLERAGYERRWGTSKTYLKSIGLDNDEDILKTKVSPQSDIMTEIVNGANRLKDDVILEAAFATVQGGKESSERTIAYPAGNNITIANTDFNVVKGLVEIRKKFAAAEVPDSAKKVVVINAAMEAILLADANFHSSDFNNTKPFVDGVVGNYLGMTLVRSERVVDDGSHVHALAFAEGSIMLGTGRSRRTDISIRKDLQSMPIQLYYEENYGALRVNEQSVFKVKWATS